MQKTNGLRNKKTIIIALRTQNHPPRPESTPGDKNPCPAATPKSADCLVLIRLVVLGSLIDGDTGSHFPSPYWKGKKRGGKQCLAM